jgi:hypothetical protein
MALMRCTSCGAGSDREMCEACAERELGALEGRRKDKLAWLYTCAHRALKLARVYKSEDGDKSLRARGCVAQVRVYRRDIRTLRTTPAIAMPGLAKTRVTEKSAARKSRSA